MSAWQRTKQWNTFARVWHIFDATWQNPLDSAPLIARYLRGLYKPIYHPMNDCGDHVIVMNTRKIAFPGQEWRYRVYHHHTLFAKGASYTRAWELHDRDPTMIMKRAVYSKLKRNLSRQHAMCRLHLFPDSDVPSDLLKNVTNQIRPLRLVPRTLDTYTEKEIDEFPKLFDFPVDHIPR